MRAFQFDVCSRPRNISESAGNCLVWSLTLRICQCTCTRSTGTYPHLSRIMGKRPACIIQKQTKHLSHSMVDVTGANILTLGNVTLSNASTDSLRDSCTYVMNDAEPCASGCVYHHLYQPLCAPKSDGTSVPVHSQFVHVNLRTTWWEELLWLPPEPNRLDLACALSGRQR